MFNFFVVSAFTLTLRPLPIKFRPFILRRLAKIGPAYWVALTFYCCGGRSLIPWDMPPVGKLDVLIGAIFGSAWTGGAPLFAVPGGWSLTCELAFYITLPALLHLIDERLWRALLITALAMIVAQLRARHVMQIPGAYNADFYYHPIQQAPVFMCGVLSALIARRVSVPRLPAVTIAALALLIVVLPLLPVSEWVVLRHVRFAIAAGVLVVFSATSAPWLLSNRAAQLLGRVSYSMYLVHFAFLGSAAAVAGLAFPPTSWPFIGADFAVLMGLTFIVSIGTFYCLERPGIDWMTQYLRQ